MAEFRNTVGGCGCMLSAANIRRRRPQLARPDLRSASWRRSAAALDKTCGKGPPPVAGMVRSCAPRHACPARIDARAYVGGDAVGATTAGQKTAWQAPGRRRSGGRLGRGPCPGAAQPHLVQADVPDQGHPHVPPLRICPRLGPASGRRGRPLCAARP